MARDRGMDSYKAPYLFSALLLCLAFFSTVGVSNGIDLISWTCNHTQYYEVCMSSLQSHPSGHNASLRGLAAISLEAGIAHAKETISYAKGLQKSYYANDTYASECLGDCLEEYREAVDRLHGSKSALKKQSYGTVNILVSGAVANSETCEDGFEEEPGLRSPLAGRNEYFLKLCSNSMAITKLLF